MRNLPFPLVLLTIIASVAHAEKPNIQDASAREQRKPNILLIVTDDQGYADAGFRSPDVHTPNLDKLVASGVELKCFYTAPACRHPKTISSATNISA